MQDGWFRFEYKPDPNFGTHLHELKTPNQRMYGYEVRRGAEVEILRNPLGEVCGWQRKIAVSFPSDDQYVNGRAFGERTFEEWWFESFGLSPHQSQ